MSVDKDSAMTLDCVCGWKATARDLEHAKQLANEHQQTKHPQREPLAAHLAGDAAELVRGIKAGIAVGGALLEALNAGKREADAKPLPGSLLDRLQTGKIKG